MFKNTDEWIKEWSRCYEESQYLRYKQLCEAFGKKPHSRENFKNSYLQNKNAKFQ